MQGTHRSGDGGTSLLCDPGSELRLGRRAKKREKKINGMEKKEKEKKKGNTTKRSRVSNSLTIIGLSDGC